MSKTELSAGSWYPVHLPKPPYDAVTPVQVPRKDREALSPQTGRWGLGWIRTAPSQEAECVCWRGGLPLTRGKLSVQEHRVLESAGSGDHSGLLAATGNRLSIPPFGPAPTVLESCGYPHLVL